MAAQINLKVKSDFAQASKELKSFGNLSEAEEKRIKKFQDSFKGEQIDKFIDKSRRVGAAVASTRGPIDGIIAQQRALERQSQSLIKKGLDPQDESVQRLAKEYDRLTKKLEINQRAQKLNEDASKAAAKALLGIAAAGAAIAVGLGKSTVELAKQGDQLAKTSARIGVGVEALQELSFAAERNGLSANALGAVFQKLNRNIGDLQAGTGTLTTFLNKSNPELAKQLKTVDNTEEAFNILTEAIAKAPTQFEKAALAQAAFGRSGQEIINFADQGADEIARLRKEAQSYGLISEETAKRSEEFVDAQRNLTQATTGLRAIFANQILPTFTNVINKVAEFLSDTEKVKKTIETTTIVLAGLTGGLIAFLIITKAKAAIEGVTFAFKALNLALKANLFAVIATVIITILIPAIILLVKNWDKVVVFIQTQIEILKERFNVFATDLKSNWIVAIEGVKAGFISLVDIIYGTVLRGIGSFLELAGKLPFVGEKFAEAGGFVKGLGESLGEAAEQSRQNVIDAIAAGDAQKTKAREVAQANIEAIKLEGQARMDALKAIEESENTSRENQVEKTQEVQDIIKELEQSWLEERLESFREFWNSNGELVKAYLETAQGVYSQVSDIINLNAQNQIATEEAAFNRRKAIIENNVEDEEERAKQIEALEKQKAKKIYEIELGLFNFRKAQGIVSAAINTAQGITKAFADLPFPIAVGAAATIGALGVTQAALIASQPPPAPPTAQTGGTFEIPDSGKSSRADRVGVMASPGETVSVTPRGEGKQQRIIVELDKQVIIDVMQDAVDSQDLRITTDNIQQGVAI